MAQLDGKLSFASPQLVDRHAPELMFTPLPGILRPPPMNARDVYEEIQTPAAPRLDTGLYHRTETGSFVGNHDGTLGGVAF